MTKMAAMRIAHNDKVTIPENLLSISGNNESLTLGLARYLAMCMLSTLHKAGYNSVCCFITTHDFPC